MTSSLPNDTAFALITETAATLCCDSSDVRTALDSFEDMDLVEVLEAMQDLGTIDIDTLSAYLAGSVMLDGALDEWLEAV